MKVLVTVISALVMVSFAALGILTGPQFTSPADHGADATSTNQGANAKPVEPSSMTPWPDRNDLNTALSTLISPASASAEQGPSSPAVGSEPAADIRVAAAHYQSRGYVPAKHQSRTKNAGHKHPRTHSEVRSA